MGIEYNVDPHIVRGLDYYTRTVFEFVSNDIGAQGTVCGGGRYDGLVSQIENACGVFDKMFRQGHCIGYRYRNSQPRNLWTFSQSCRFTNAVLQNQY